MKKLTEQTIFANRYIFQRLLGRGGFSEVWLAIDRMTSLEVAVKVYAPGQGLDDDGMDDFCKELSRVYNLNHTNLLKPHYVDNWEGMPYLVMTYCPQGSCQNMIGKMTEEQIWKMIYDVASGLAYLHEHGIIHQDIKPDNILIDPLGNYVITDFGISVEARSTLRKSMNIATMSGTTAYMGPERFSKDPTPIQASDIWSLGATAYELLTGRAPFGEIGGGLQKGGAEIPTIKQTISSELRQTIAHMLAKEPWERPTAAVLSQKSVPPRSKKPLYISFAMIGALAIFLGITLFYQYGVVVPGKVEKLKAIYAEETIQSAKFIASLSYKDNEKKMHGPIHSIAKVQNLEHAKHFSKTKLEPQSITLQAAYLDSLRSIRNALDREIAIEKSYLRGDVETTWLKTLKNKQQSVNAIITQLEIGHSMQEISDSLNPVQK